MIGLEKERKLHPLIKRLDKMKIIFVTDLHGKREKYDMLFDVIKTHGADILINGGDMLPWKTQNYPLKDQKDFIVNYLENHFRSFEKLCIYYLCLLGNDDLGILDELFKKTCEKFSFIHDIAQKKVKIGEYEFIGMNWVSDNPFTNKDRCRKDSNSETTQKVLPVGLISTPSGWREIKDWINFRENLPTIEEELKNLPAPENFEKAIYVMHMPPSNLGLDQCWHGGEVGSKAIYNFIKEKQPFLTLHGHIHESPDKSGIWLAHLGKTMCIQPGQREEKLVYVIVDLESMKIERVIV